MSAYKLTVHGGSCKRTCEIVAEIRALGDVSYSKIKRALQGFEEYTPSYVGDFDNDDYVRLFALSRKYPEASFRLATCDFEMDPEAVERYTFRNADDFGEYIGEAP